MIKDMKLNLLWEGVVNMEQMTSIDFSWQALECGHYIYYFDGLVQEKRNSRALTHRFWWTVKMEQNRISLPIVMFKHSLLYGALNPGTYFPVPKH